VLLREITFVGMTEFIIFNKPCAHIFDFIKARNFLVGKKVFEPQNLYTHTHARTHAYAEILFKRRIIKCGVQTSLLPSSDFQMVVLVFSSVF